MVRVTRAMAGAGGDDRLRPAGTGGAARRGTVATMTRATVAAAGWGV